MLVVRARGRSRSEVKDIGLHEEVNNVARGGLTDRHLFNDQAGSGRQAMLGVMHAIFLPAGFLESISYFHTVVEIPSSQ
ncbi:unnamed protein product [Leuciscus chuanchicus]